MKIFGHYYVIVERMLFAKKIRGYNGLRIGDESKMKVGPYTKRLRDQS